MRFRFNTLDDCIYENFDEEEDLLEYIKNNLYKILAFQRIE